MNVESLSGSGRDARSNAHAFDPLRERAMAFLAQTPSLPLPGRGRTLQRWRDLAAISAESLSLAKVLEAHFDAQAILADLGEAPMEAGQLWAVWAAEPPGLSLKFSATNELVGTLTGQKAWCSGADLVTHALITCQQGGQRILCRMPLNVAALAYDASHWQAVGMAGISSGTLTLHDAPAHRVGGEPGVYLARPGFWHGGAGIAACWFGAAAAIANRVRVDPRVASNPHVAAHLGAMDLGLSAVASLMRETAALIDAHPDQAHRHAVIRLRALVDRVASDVVNRCGRALGAGPLCTEADHARRCADLTTFLRQSHAEADEQRLGESLAEAEDDPWAL